VGAKWYYEYHDSFVNQEVGYDLYEVVDTLLVFGFVSYDLQVRRRMSASDRDEYYENEQYAMWIEDGTRVYFYIPSIVVYELTYDFDNDSMYYMVLYQGGNTYIKTNRRITVDSVVVRNLAGHEVEMQYCSGRYLIKPVEVIKGIGSYKYGFYPLIGYEIRPPYMVPLLRCFSVDTMHYQFVDYPCDATWDIITSSSMPHAEGYRVYPNPHFGEVKVEGFSPGARYRLYDVHGRMLGRGRLVEGIIEVPYSGVVLLEIRDAKGVWRKKLVGMVAAD